MPDFPDQWADTMRWWACGGAAIALPLLAKALRGQAINWLIGGREPVSLPIERLLGEKIGLTCFLLFALTAGGIIPFTSRVSGFDQSHIAFRWVMTLAWTLAALGAWSSAAAFARHRWSMIAAGVAWLIAVAFAAVATAAGV